MSILIPISKAKARLSELVRQAADDDVILMNHSTPAAVLISASRYDALREEIEDPRTGSASMSAPASQSPPTS